MKIIQIEWNNENTYLRTSMVGQLVILIEIWLIIVIENKILIAFYFSDKYDLLWINMGAGM